MSDEKKRQATPARDRIRLPAIIENLRPLIRFIRDHAEGIGLDDRRCRELELAADEVLTNIIHYAYPQGTGEITVACGSDPSGRLSVEIADEGVPFNPLERKPPDITSAVEDREIGGLGIFLAGKMVDEITYRRKKNSNLLTLYKRMPERA